MPRRTILFALALGAGAVAAWAAVPALFGRTAHDLVRTRALLRALTDHSPALVVFGDSRAEAAVDAAQLSQELPGAPLALNLASSAQTPALSFLLYQQLPPSVRTIVQFVVFHPEDTAPIEPHSWNALYMYGYRPSEATLAALGRCAGPSVEAMLRAPDAAQRVGARWALQQSLDDFARSWLRHDLQIERERHDLFFPTPYTSRLPEPAFAQSLRELQTTPAGWKVVVPRCLLEAMADDARAAGRRLVFVAPPLHPATVAAGYGRPRGDLQATAAAKGVAVVDLTEALDDAEYVDPRHAGPLGARKVTSRLAAALREAR